LKKHNGGNNNIGGEIKAEKDARSDIRRVLNHLVYRGEFDIPYINLEAETLEKHGISKKKFAEILEYYIFNKQIKINEHEGVKFIILHDEWIIKDV
jgi:hypothetical protein